MLEDEPHHFPRRIRSVQIGVGAGGLPPDHACSAPWMYEAASNRQIDQSKDWTFSMVARLRTLQHLALPACQRFANMVLGAAVRETAHEEIVYDRV